MDWVFDILGGHRTYGVERGGKRGQEGWVITIEG